MSPWSWDEFYFARETATNNYSLKGLFEAFCKYGGTARNLYKKKPDIVEQEIQTAIEYSNLSKLFFGLDRIP